jgi:hypothetical protein
VNGNPSPNVIAPQRPASLGVACAVLTAVTVLALPLFGWVGYAKHAGPGVAAAGVAAGVCWLGAMVALLLTAFPRGPKQAVSRVLLGMLFRMGLPLVVGAILARRGGPLSEAGVFGMIVAFYFVTLVAETWLALRLIPQTNRQPCGTKAF